MSIYFDNAATTQIDPRVVEAMAPYFNEFYGNPSSVHHLGRKGRAAIEQARKTVAKHLNANPSQIFFTSGGTESNNMALRCSVSDLGVKRVITTAIEHHCILHILDYFERTNCCRFEFVKLDEKGLVDFEDLEERLASSEEPTLVSIMHANNEIGTKQDLKAIVALAKKYNALTHSDSVQTVGHWEIDVEDIGIDMISASAHKFHGPKGIGFIYLNSSAKLRTFFFGGGQERNMRPGTENIYGIVGLAKALDIAMEELLEDQQKVRAIKNYAIEKIRENFPEVRFNGDISEKSNYTVLNVSFPKNDMLLFSLDMKEICASGGSACNSGATQTTHVIKALGGGEDRTAVRFSFSRFNELSEIDELVEVLKGILVSSSAV